MGYVCFREGIHLYMQYVYYDIWCNFMYPPNKVGWRVSLFHPLINRVQNSLTQLATSHTAVLAIALAKSFKPSPPANQILNPFQPPIFAPKWASKTPLTQEFCQLFRHFHCSSPWPATFQRHWKRSNRYHGSPQFNHSGFKGDLGHLRCKTPWKPHPEVNPRWYTNQNWPQKKNILTEFVILLNAFWLERTFFQSF